MTELAVPETGGLPAVSDAFVEKFPALSPEIDINSALAEALGPGGEVRLSDLTIIKVPAAELDRLMVPDDNGRPQPVDLLTGVPVGMTSRRSFWIEKNPSGKPPDCSSRDLLRGTGVYGVGSEGNPSGLCESCPMSAIGSANTGTNASACKEQRLLFLLTSNELLPYMIVVPPGSLPNHKQFGMALFKRGVRGPLRGRDEITGKEVRGSSWLAVEVGVKLEQDQNPAGQRYNKLVFGIERRLAPEELATVSAYGRFIDDLITKQADMLDNVAAREAGGGTAPVSDDEQYDGDGELLDDGVQVPAASSRR